MAAMVADVRHRGTCIRQGGDSVTRVAEATFRTPLWYIPVFGIDGERLFVLTSTHNDDASH
jgi:hypothetical protein